MARSKNGVKFNIKGFETLRKQPKVRAVLKDMADDVQRDASENGRVDGYMVTELLLEDPRGAVSVMATGHARRHNNKTFALIKALDAARRGTV